MWQIKEKSCDLNAVAKLQIMYRAEVKNTQGPYMFRSNLFGMLWEKLKTRRKRLY